MNWYEDNDNEVEYHQFVLDKVNEACEQHEKYQLESWMTVLTEAINRRVDI
jgi:hypothetical protein